MTTDERFEALEKALETSVRRQRITITALVLVAVAAAVMAAAPQSRDGTFDRMNAGMITATHLAIVNNEGTFQAHIGSDGSGGYLNVRNAAGKHVVLIGIGSDGSGGDIRIINKTGEEVVQIHADEYGNGYVGAFNRKGMGRTLQPGN